MKQDNICRIPVKATYSIAGDKPVLIAAEWVDIPADMIARLLLRGFGADAVFRGEVPTGD